MQSASDVAWRVRAAPEIMWRCWDGEFVVYCELTGHTHRLDGLAAEIFERLLSAPASSDRLARSIAADQPELEAELPQAIPVVLERLASAQIIQSTPS